MDVRGPHLEGRAHDCFGSGTTTKGTFHSAAESENGEPTSLYTTLQRTGVLTKERFHADGYRVDDINGVWIGRHSRLLRIRQSVSQNQVIYTQHSCRAEKYTP